MKPIRVAGDLSNGGVAPTIAMREQGNLSRQAPFQSTLLFYFAFTDPHPKLESGHTLKYDGVVVKGPLFLKDSVLLML